MLAEMLTLPDGPAGAEFHASIRVRELAVSTRFFGWLLNSWPREWTDRHATFIRRNRGLNFVLVVSDGTELHRDTLYHLGLALPDKAALIDAHHRAVAVGAHVDKPPRTTWTGTPLHEPWLTDADGTLIETYARLADAELAAMPDDQAPEYLAPQTQPPHAAQKYCAHLVRGSRDGKTSPSLRSLGQRVCVHPQHDVDAIEQRPSPELS